LVVEKEFFRRYVITVVEKSELSDIQTDSVNMDAIIGPLSSFCWNDYSTVLELIAEALSNSIEDLSKYINGSVDFKCFKNILKRCCWIVVFSKEIITTGHKMRLSYRNPELYLKEDAFLIGLVFKMLQFSYKLDHNCFKVSIMLFFEEFIQNYFLDVRAQSDVTKFI
jgi:hypothetical protein